jgi:hypothetical protein
MSIDPVMGGCTNVHGGHPPSILCAGYVGSTLMGGLFILGGFDSLAAKLLSFVAGVGLIAPLSLVRDKLYVARFFRDSRSIVDNDDTCIRTILLTIAYEGLLVGFWFIDHAYARFYFREVAGIWFMGRIYRQPLRWYMLFLGMIQ